jgi:virginiamycin B lyase
MFAMPDRGDGAMWFTEFNQSRIGRITIAIAGTVTEYNDGISDGSSPNGIALGPEGDLWFTEYNGSRIGRLPKN